MESGVDFIGIVFTRFMLLFLAIWQSTSQRGENRQKLITGIGSEIYHTAAKIRKSLPALFVRKEADSDRSTLDVVF